jgi:hypothetical protein
MSFTAVHPIISYTMYISVITLFDERFYQTVVSRWLFLNANSAIFSAISWREQVNFQWDDDDVWFVLDQHA